MLKKFKKSEKGFTLIELLIVVAIIGILAAIAIPQFASYRERAFNSSAQSDLRTIRTSVEAIYAEIYRYPTVAFGTTWNTGRLERTDTDTPANNINVPLSSNVEANYAGENNLYSIGARNTQGTRVFATTQEASNIFYHTTMSTNIPALSSDLDWASSGNWNQL